MGLCLGKTTSSSPWPELPPELAGVILARLPSHADRLSFGAVCRNWHHAAHNPGPLLPPAMPWLNLGLGTYQSLPDGRLHRFLETPTTGAVRASAGGWLMRELEVKHPRYRCFLQHQASFVRRHGDPLGVRRWMDASTTGAAAAAITHSRNTGTFRSRMSSWLRSSCARPVSSRPCSTTSRLIINSTLPFSGRGIGLCGQVLQFLLAGIALMTTTTKT